MPLVKRPARIAITPFWHAALMIASVSSRRGLLGVAVLHQLDQHHRAEAAHVADQRMALLPALERLAQHRADALGAREERRLAHHLDGRDRGDAGHRVAAVGAAHAAGVRGVHDLGAAGGGADRHAGAERLGR